MRTQGWSPGRPIPERVFRRAPTAELAPHQADQDTLPPYAQLDRILQAYVEDDLSLSQILARNRLGPATVKRVIAPSINGAKGLRA